MKDDTILTPSTDSTLHNVEFCSTPSPTVDNSCLIRSFSLNLLQSLQAFNSLLRNDQCLNSAIPFHCNITEALCGDNSTFIPGLKEQCIQVRDHDCAVEWRAFEKFFDTLLPDCTSFAEDGSLTFSRAPALVCPDEFDLYCDSFCLGSCADFYQLSREATIAANTVIIILIFLGLLGGVFNLIVCILNREKM